MPYKSIYMDLLSLLYADLALFGTTTSMLSGGRGTVWRYTAPNYVERSIQERTDSLYVCMFVCATLSSVGGGDYNDVYCGSLQFGPPCCCRVILARSGNILR